MALPGISERNGLIRKWVYDNVPLMSREAIRLGIRNYTGAFYGTFKAKTYTSQGKVYGGGYRMPRHAIFVHKGVGRGHKASSASPGAMSSAFLGKKARTPKPFFNSVIDKRLPKLADDVARLDADIVSKNIFIK